MRLLTKEAVALRANMSVRTLDGLIKAKKGPRRTIVGKRPFVTDDDCDAWLLSRREGSEAIPGEETAA
jgi:hypothetical protein